MFPQSHESIWTDLFLHHEINYVGSRSQKPSSWVKALELLAAGTVVPEKIVTSIDPLEKWRDGFDKMIRGEGAKGVIVLDDSLK